VVVQSVRFVATHLIGAAIAESARKGDQLFVEGKIRRYHWTTNGSDDATFVVTGFHWEARGYAESPPRLSHQRGYRVSGNAQASVPLETLMACPKPTPTHWWSVP
jgi:single-stranded DNA-binding protein